MRQAERILSEGAAALADAELLHVVLGARDELLACRLLSRGLPSLRRAGPGELLLESGMSATLAARVMAALEIGRRVALAPAPERRRLLRARDVATVLWARLAHLPHEEFWTVLMNSRLQEIRCVQIARGGLTQCSVSPREAFAPAIVHRAPAVAFVHNHPSGDSAPSGEDQRLQLLLDEAGHALGVRVVDHLVLAEGGLHSAVEGASPPPDPVSLVPREGVGEGGGGMELSEALKEHFGYDTFRKGQEAIVRSVLSGRPTIAILPTGGGKSLCYQLPALLLEGTTVVVSPLVALMKDQVDALRARAIAATFVNSSLPESERQERQSALRRGEYRLVYVAPERFKSPSFLSAMGALKVPLLAVDEAHCISAWGHDFRPEYQQLARAREQLRAERVLALTATATPEVRRDIADALELREPRVFVAGFDRPNLFIEVLRVTGDKDKLGRLVALSRPGGPGIVYAATRKNVEKVVASLRASGVDALGYHAGMPDAERSSVQERFVRGEVPVIAATNAFGMGVDKADIRFVAHFDVPRSLEAYYQEIGRAGRDGLPSHALLLFNFADVMMQRRMIEAGRPSRDLVERAWETARELLEGSVDQLAQACGVSAPELSGAVRLLESAGHLERGLGRDGRFFVATPAVAPEDLAVDFELLELRVARERQMLDRLGGVADTPGCRRQNRLRYFGDADAPP